jgi:poly-gamma-glutamate capsule biosynthesis protein CapA/YwtB (metallophosphatase superfamily)
MLYLFLTRGATIMKKYFMIIFILFLSINITGCSNSSNTTISKQNAIIKSPIKNTNIEPAVNDTIKKITISAAGDCTLGTDKSFSYNGSFTSEVDKQNDDFSYFFRNVKDIFDKDDITIVNLESPLTTSNQMADKQFRFKGDPKYVDILKLGSVEVVNIANNHTRDYLQQGVNDTIKYLRQGGIGFVGEGNKYLTEKNGIKIGMLGYTGWSNDISIKNNIKKDIQYLKDNGAKLVIVSFHWGEENAHMPNAIQKDLARFTIDSGADLVLGHHPHVIDGIEEYKGKYIVYSLGNFCFGGNLNPSDKDTFIFQQIFTFKNNELSNDIDTKTIPCLISSVKSRNNYQPTIAEGIDSKRINSEITTYSNGLK